MKYKLNRTLLAATLAAAFAATIPSALLAQGVETTKSKADSAKAAADTNPVRTFGGFVDTYYAWDANQPHNFDRANYAGEPKLGVVSGPNVSQFIQEATVGYQLAPSVWLDGGIFFSHLGYEGWISSDNLAYSRSLVADFSPYYETGVKLTWAASPKLTATFAVLNGWQDISVYDRWQFAAVYSLGTQGRSTLSGGSASWWGMTSFAKYHATSTLALVSRFEHYEDPSQVIVVTGLPASFDATGGSLGVDVNFRAPVLWRTEVRGLRSTNAVWPLHEAGTVGRNNVFFVTSLAPTF